MPAAVQAAAWIEGFCSVLHGKKLMMVMIMSASYCR
jgi:hypothetical protein